MMSTKLASISCKSVECDPRCRDCRGDPESNDDSRNVLRWIEAFESWWDKNIFLAVVSRSEVFKFTFKHFKFWLTFFYYFWYQKGNFSLKYFHTNKLK